MRLRNRRATLHAHGVLQVGGVEAADRLALRELFDAYAHCADRRDAEGQKALFTEDTRFAVYMDGEGSEPTYVLDGRDALTPVFADLNRYEATTHFNDAESLARVSRGLGDAMSGLSAASLAPEELLETRGW